MSTRWRAAAPALWIFLASRAAIGAVAAVAAVAFEGSFNPERGRWDSGRLHDLGAAVDVWARWDSDWYLRIAESGYSWPSSTPAFFPLYPGLVAGLGRALAGHYVLAGVLVSLAAAASAFVVLFHLAETKLGRAGAAWTLVLLAVFPTSLFLGAVYAEALYLLLAVGTFAAAERGRFGYAGTLAGLALLTRPAGLALLPALAVFAWRADDRGRALARAGVALPLAAVYPLVLWAWIGRPLAFVDAQAVVWERRLSPAGPLGGIVEAVGEARVLDLAVAVGLVLGGVAAWRLLGAPYGLYTLVSVGIPLSVVAADDPLLSIQRFAVVAFPALMALARLLESRRAAYAVATILAAWSAVYVVRWALWYWVA